MNMLDILCPMHMIISPKGHILHCGPALSKLGKGRPQKNQRILECFQIWKPKNLQTFAQLQGYVGQKLSLSLRSVSGLRLTGILLHDQLGENYVLNIAFGISLPNAVNQFSLTLDDFAPTDLAPEMLFLIEANHATQRESRKLTQRLEGARAIAQEQAYTDALTKLKNRRALDVILPDMISRGGPMSVMHIDLDWFKKVNDTYGHAAGDATLQKVAKDMLATVRKNHDMVFRTGGDEFVILLPKLCDPERLLQISNLLIEKLEIPLNFNGNNCKISGSIGIFHTSDIGEMHENDILEYADQAAYEAKRRGKGKAVSYTTLTNTAEEQKI